ncbi:MAG: zf-HC2 domain-containing protein [Planctomycetes bacterium]|nr:zf-HC2 domain-containing protein [Planctomycetota bacterium]
MPDCATVHDLLPLFSLGELQEEQAAAVSAHLDSCPACRAALDRIRRADDIVSQALAAVEPGAGFEERIVSALRSPAAQPAVPRPARRKRGLFLALAAAACLLLAAGVVVHFRKPAASLLDGSLAGGETVIRPGRTYVAAARTAIGMPGETRALLAKDARFSVGKSTLHLEKGSCYVKRPHPARDPAVLVTEGLSVEVQDAELFFCAGPAASHAAMPPFFMAKAYAGDDTPTQAALVVVFRGSAEARIGGRVYRLKEGHFIFSDDTSAGPRRAQEFIDSTLARVNAAEAEASLILKSVERYSAVVAGYDGHLAHLENLAASPAGGDAAEAAELNTRITLVKDVRAAHQERLDAFNRAVAAIRTPELAADGKRLLRVQQASAGYGTAAAVLLEYY